MLAGSYVFGMIGAVVIYLFVWMKFGGKRKLEKYDHIDGVRGRYRLVSLRYVAWSEFPEGNHCDKIVLAGG